MCVCTDIHKCKHSVHNKLSDPASCWAPSTPTEISKRQSHLALYKKRPTGWKQEENSDPILWRILIFGFILTRDTTPKYCNYPHKGMELWLWCSLHGRLLQNLEALQSLTPRQTAWWAAPKPWRPWEPGLLRSCKPQSPGSLVLGSPLACCGVRWTSWQEIISVKWFDFNKRANSDNVLLEFSWPAPENIFTNLFK